MLQFISDQPEEIKAMNLYLQCLIELNQFEEIDTFIESLDEKTQNTNEIKQIIKKLKF